MTLANIGRAAVPPLEEALRNENPRVRAGAASALKRLGLKAAPAESHLERKIEHNESSDAISSGAHDSVRVTPNEVTGYGSSATWSQRT